MQSWTRFLTVFLCGVTLTTSLHANDCNSDVYRRYNPDKCSQSKSAESGLSFATTAAIAGGTAALIGGTIALLGASSSDGGSSSGNNSNRTPTQSTITTYNMVGGDVDSVQLASVIDTKEYAQNTNQYNDIRVGYSLARGYTGKNSKIAVFDSAKYTWHGANVSYLASGYIAPDAHVDNYIVADYNGQFSSFNKIGDIIKSAGDANIYNFSWSADSFATQVRSRQQLEGMTSAHFINSLVDTAVNNDGIFVWAAGNDYASQSSAFSALPLFISELDGHFVNVVAWDSNTGALADYSNACGITKNFCITAPGTDITTPESDTPISGTSFATPIVSAAIAVIREAFPYMKSSEITSLLFATARDLGDTGIDAIYGHGMLDLEHATRPYGAALVPLNDTTTIALNTARVSAPIGNKIKSKNIKFAFVDSFGRAFDAKLNDNISIKNRSIGLERLREAENNSIKFGNIEFGFKNTELLMGDGFLQTDSQNRITFIGFNDHVNLGNNILFYRTTLGTTTPRTSSESMVSGFSNIYTASITMGLKRGNWQLSIGTPDTIISGNMYLNTLTGRANNGAYIFQNHTIDLASRPSIEYAATYKFMTAAFVDNPFGRDEFYMLARGKINF